MTKIPIVFVFVRVENRYKDAQKCDKISNKVKCLNVYSSEKTSLNFYVSKYI